MEVRCIRCNRKLTGKLSRSLRIGSSCQKAMPGYTKARKAEAKGQLSIFEQPKKGIIKKVSEWLTK